MPTRTCPGCVAILAQGGGPPGSHLLHAFLSQRIAAAMLLTYRLSAKEKTIIEFLGLGYDNRARAQELQISERTVKRHVTAILGKLNLESRLQAGLTALASWLTDAPVHQELFSQANDALIVMKSNSLQNMDGDHDL